MKRTVRGKPDDGWGFHRGRRAGGDRVRRRVRVLRSRAVPANPAVAALEVALAAAVIVVALIVSWPVLAHAECRYEPAPAVVDFHLRDLLLSRPDRAEVIQR